VTSSHNPPKAGSPNNRIATVQRCERTDLLTDQCAHCRPRAYSPPPVGGVRFGPEFTARYPGKCALCDRRIEIDDPIAGVLDDCDDVEGYACARCVEDGVTA
jgi:hypothetical protein